MTVRRGRPHPASVRESRVIAAAHVTAAHLQHEADRRHHLVDAYAGRPGRA